MRRHRVDIGRDDIRLDAIDRDPGAEDTPAGKNETKRETKVLWDFKGCEDHRLMNRVVPYVYKGNAYLYVFLPGLKTMIVKVPLARMSRSPLVVVSV